MPDRFDEFEAQFGGGPPVAEAPPAPTSESGPAAPSYADFEAQYGQTDAEAFAATLDALPRTAPPPKTYATAADLARESSPVPTPAALFGAEPDPRTMAQRYVGDEAARKEREAQGVEWVRRNRAALSAIQAAESMSGVRVNPDYFRKPDGDLDYQKAYAVYNDVYQTHRDALSGPLAIGARAGDTFLSATTFGLWNRFGPLNGADRGLMNVSEHAGSKADTFAQTGAALAGALAPMKLLGTVEGSYAALAPLVGAERASRLAPALAMGFQQGTTAGVATGDVGEGLKAGAQGAAFGYGAAALTRYLTPGAAAAMGRMLPAPAAARGGAMLAEATGNVVPDAVIELLRGEGIDPARVLANAAVGLATGAAGGSPLARDPRTSPSDVVPEEAVARARVATPPPDAPPVVAPPEPVVAPDAPVAPPAPDRFAQIEAELGASPGPVAEAATSAPVATGRGAGPRAVDPSTLVRPDADPRTYTVEEMAKQIDDTGRSDIQERFVFHESDRADLASIGIEPSKIGNVVYASRDTTVGGGRPHAYAIDLTKIPASDYVQRANGTRFPGIKGRVPPEAIIDLGPVDPAAGPLRDAEIVARMQKASAPISDAVPVDAPAVEPATLGMPLDAAKPGEVVSLSTKSGKGYTDATVVKVTDRRVVVETKDGERESIRKDDITDAKILASPGDSARMPMSMERDPATAGEKPIGPHEVIAALGDVVEAPLRTGRMRTQDAGYYMTRERVIRTRNANDIPVAAHEVGHALSAEDSVKAAVEDPSVKRELIALGRALYGDKRPAGGYMEEGVGELVRLHVTDPEGLATKAPAAAKWFDSYLAANPERAASLGAAREAAVRYGKQGAQARAEGGMLIDRAGPGPLERFKRAASVKNWVEEFQPLEAFGSSVEAVTGRTLPGSEHPARVAEAARGSAPGIVKSWISGSGVTDPQGNLKDASGTPISMSLESAIAPAVKVNPDLKNFRAYLWAKHALDVHAAGMDPGMSKADAEFIVSRASPEFAIAADNVYRWRTAVLKYAEASGLLSAETIDTVTKKWPHSVPLVRVFDDATFAGREKQGGGGGPVLKTLRGSSRRIRDPLATMIEQAVRIQRAADRQRVLGAIVKHAKVPGIGKVIEEVPVEKVPHETTIEAIRKQLEAAGAYVADADLEATVTHYTQADRPKGKDPIIAVRDADGKQKWYQVPESLWESLDGLDVVRLPKILDLTFGAVARVFKLGTTGVRASFGLVRNPIRDFPTYMMQSKAAPAEAAAEYARAMADTFKGKTGQDSEFYDLFHRLGVSMAQPLAADSDQVRGAVRNLSRGKVSKIVHDPIGALREVLSITESVPRIAEMRVAAKEVGWDGTGPLTPDQAIAIATAGKQVTTDFAAGGKVARIINQVVPFFNANIQGARTFARTFRRNPAGTALRGLALLTGPTLALWWANKDKEWYRDMPLRERYTYWHFEDGDNLLRVPRPMEWGNVFATLPEAALDSIYAKDPAMVKAAVGKTFDDAIPDLLGSPLVRVPKEQLQNEVDFTKAPIVPRSEEDRPASEQYGPETTAVAKWLGDTFGWSPRRIDHAISGTLGPVGRDVAEAIGGTVGGERGAPDKSSLPIVGTLYRRGGREGTGSLLLEQMYRRLDVARERAASVEKPETEAEKADRVRFENAAQAIKVLQAARLDAKTLPERAAITAKMREVARDVLDGGTGGFKPPTPRAPGRPEAPRPPWVPGVK